MSRKTTVIPSAARLMTSLRDIGYDLPSAVADLVDNSIDADATTVRIDVGRKGERSFIRITDDGSGMTERTLDEAMRYGSRRGYEERQLGKFGLGLKTASLSQCRRLTVATRSTPSGRIRIRRWDLDHVSEHDTWALERLTPSECPPHLTAPLGEETGTVVLWEKLDRILAYSRPDGERAIKALEAMADAIAEHLSMVFHRFLAGETTSGRRLDVYLNGELLEPWDPFARSEPAIRSLAKQTFTCGESGVAGTIVVQPYVLPGQSSFSTVEAHTRASGPRKWNRQQGFYIYRGDRMIQSGGWNRLRTTDEHSKLARIAVDVPSTLDDHFQINVAKMRVSLPEEVRPWLGALAAGVVAAAQEAYRHRLTLIPGQGHEAISEDAHPDDTDWTLARLWPVITDVIARELRGHPELMDRVLVALANARPPEQDVPSVAPGTA